MRTAEQRVVERLVDAVAHYVYEAYAVTRRQQFLHTRLCTSTSRVITEGCNINDGQRRHLPKVPAYART